VPYAPNTSIRLPPEVEGVFREFRTCEMSTLARDNSPITWPTLPFWRPEEGRFLITTSIGLPHKAFNIRRNPRVSLLFSDPTASGMTNPPAVLVQGDAEAPDEVETTLEGFEDEMRRALQRQPAGGKYSGNPLTRYLFDWYYMRLMIYVTPRRILWWPAGDFEQTPLEVEADRVG
jgi:Pyridoxamine 5'-phosphate oxidase